MERLWREAPFIKLVIPLIVGIIAYNSFEEFASKNGIYTYIFLVGLYLLFNNIKAFRHATFKTFKGVLLSMLLFFWVII